MNHLFGEIATKLVPIAVASSRPFQFFFANGAAGVRIFFVLSGFLITLLILRERAAHGRIDIPQFFLRRTLRIWPLYFLVLAMAFVVVPNAARLFHVGDMMPTERLLPFLLFAGNFEGLHVRRFGNVALLLSPVWSISVEEQFYLLWPFLMARASRRTTAAVLAVTGSVSLLGYVVFHGDHAALYFQTMPNFLPIVMGATTAYAVFYRPAELNEWLRRTGRFGRRMVLLCTLVVAMWTLESSNVVTFLACVVSVSLATVLLIVDGVIGSDDILSLSKRRALVALGKYTYSLYMVHMLVELAVDFVAKRASIHGAGRLALAFFALGLSLALSYVTYRFVELPFLRLKRHFGEAGRGTPRPSAP